MATGETITPSTYGGYNIITLTQGQKVEITLKYLSESVLPAKFDKAKDALYYYCMVEDNMYVVVWYDDYGVGVVAA